MKVINLILPIQNNYGSLQLNSVSGRNTEALQIFFSPLVLLSRLCPQHRCLFSGFCWYVSVSLCCVSSKCSVFIAEVSAPHTIPGIRSLEPISLLDFNTLTLTVRLSQVCSLFTAFSTPVLSSVSAGWSQARGPFQMLSGTCL